MSRDGAVREAARALQRHATRHHRVNTRHPRYAVVRVATPLAAELTDAAIVLDEEEMTLGYAVQSARTNGTLAPGDLLLVQEMEDGTWHALDAAHNGVWASAFVNQQQLLTGLAAKAGASATALPPAATDLASAITLVNAIRAELISSGVGT